MVDPKQAAPVKLKLNPGVICGFMSNMAMSGDRECMQLTEIDCQAQEVDNLMKCAEEMKDCTIINFSNNGLADVATLKDLSRLTRLNLSNNRIKSMAVFEMEEAFPNLKWLDISYNKFPQWPAFKCPKLDNLNISGNKLEKVNEGWTGHANLRVISAFDNKFKNLSNFKNCPKLEELYLAQNNISSLGGCEGGLPSLKRLHVRRNKIATIDEELPEMPELEYVNLRHNNLETLETCFKIFQFPKVIDISIINNPIDKAFSSFELMLAEFLIKKPSIQRFCKERVQECNQLEAVHLAHYRWDIAEAKRKADEEAARKAAEQQE